MATVNYAQIAGYNSLPPAIVFSVLYLFLLLWFLRQSIAHRNHVHFSLTFFCLTRVAGFIIRSVLVAPSNTGNMLGLVQADQILFGVGYFGLLYSSYSLVLNLAQAIRHHPAKGHQVIQVTQNRRLLRFAMLIAVALGIAASSNVNDDGSLPSSSDSLREASTIIFLCLTALLLIHTAYFAWIKLKNPTSPIAEKSQDSFGAKHAIFILVVIALLLLIREAFITATMIPSKHYKQFNEKYWYPFIATTEIVAVICYLIPGLTLKRKEKKWREMEKEQEVEHKPNETV